MTETMCEKVGEACERTSEILQGCSFNTVADTFETISYCLYITRLILCIRNWWMVYGQYWYQTDAGLLRHHAKLLKRKATILVIHILCWKAFELR